MLTTATIRCIVNQEKKKEMKTMTKLYKTVQKLLQIMIILQLFHRNSQ